MRSIRAMHAARSSRAGDCLTHTCDSSIFRSPGLIGLSQSLTLVLFTSFSHILHPSHAAPPEPQLRENFDHRSPGHTDALIGSRGFNVLYVRSYTRYSTLQSRLSRGSRRIPVPAINPTYPKLNSVLPLHARSCRQLRSSILPNSPLPLHD